MGVGTNGAAAGMMMMTIMACVNQTIRENNSHLMAFHSLYAAILNECTAVKLCLMCTLLDVKQGKQNTDSSTAAECSVIYQLYNRKPAGHSNGVSVTSQHHFLLWLLLCFLFVFILIQFPHAPA